MSMQQSQRRQALGERIAAISRRSFIEQCICRVLAQSSGTSPEPDNCHVTVIQNDGTGAATE